MGLGRINLQPTWQACAITALTPLLSLACTNGLKGALTSTSPDTAPPTAALSPSAYLTASENLKYVAGGWVDANIGDTIEFRWNGSSVDSESSNFVLDSPDNCSGSSGTTGPYGWVANTPTGATTLTTLPCQAGRTYAYYYQGTHASTGTTPQAVAVVHVMGSSTSPPQGTIRVNAIDSLGNDIGTPVGYLEVNPGDSIKVTWNGNGGTATSANVTLDSPDTCDSASTSYPQIALATTGTTTRQIAPCSAGHIYTATLNVTRGTTTAVESMAVVRVRANPSLPAPTALLAANGTAGMLEIQVGQALSYQWSSTNADQGDSWATMTSLNGATTCEEDANRGTQPTSWNALGAIGQIQPFTIPSCMGRHTYTITFTSFQAQTGKSASSTLILQVDPLPGS